MSSTFDMEKERKNIESSAQSSLTNAPNDPEPFDLPEKVATEEPELNDEAQYPHGLKLLIVVVALGMSIFLVALDMVCPSIPQ
jgi:hypothetical protein